MNTPAYSFDNASSHASNVSLDLLVARGAHDERAARIDGRQESVAVLEAMFEVPAYLHGLADNPRKFKVLGFNQHDGRMRRIRGTTRT